MRPPAHPQSAFRAPLNAILSTEANVRILRVLAAAGVPMGRGELARRTMLQPSGVRLATKRLVQLGLVQLVGTGPHQQVTWRDQHPLAAPLAALLHAEAARVDRLLMGLRRIAEALRPPTEALWIEGPFARGVDRPGEPLEVGIVVGSKEVEATSEYLRDAVVELERSEDVTIEFRIRTRADLGALSRHERTALTQAMPIFGIPVEALLNPATAHALAGRIRTHAHEDRRARALAAVVAEKLAKDPGLLERARVWLRRRLAEASPSERRELHEWERALRTMSPTRLQRFLIDEGERATRLRQTLPFLDVLSPEERETILKEVEG